MKIILLQNVKGLGNKNDVRNVSDGYARNFLISKKLAVAATPYVELEMEKIKIIEKQNSEKLKNLTEEVARKISDKKFYFYPEVGKNQEVFAPINKKEINEAIEKSLDFISNEEKKDIMDKIKIELKHSLKKLGSHKIKINLSKDIETEIEIILDQKLQ